MSDIKPTELGGYKVSDREHRLSQEAIDVGESAAAKLERQRSLQSENYKRAWFISEGL